MGWLKNFYIVLSINIMFETFDFVVFFLLDP